MAHDSDPTLACGAATPARPSRAHPKDLEAIVSALECAAVLLSPENGSTFGEARLIELAVELGGPECPFDRRDLEIVLPRLASIGKAGRGLYRLI